MFIRRSSMMTVVILAASLLGACKPNSKPNHAAPLEPAPVEPGPPATKPELTPAPQGPPAPATSAPPTDTARPAIAVWPFWPEKLRVHPLTRLITDPHTGQNLLEARIEFFDVAGATSKASGQLTLRLFGEASQPDSAEPLETWNLNLRDLAVNALQYDDVTRTYLMRLQIDPTRLTAAPELRAYFVGANGALLNGSMLLKP